MAKLGNNQLEEINHYWINAEEADQQMILYLVSSEDKQTITNSQYKVTDSQAILGNEKAQQELRKLLNFVDIQLNRYHKIICQAVCVEFDYCKKRREKEFEKESYQLAVVVADALITLATTLPVPITLLSVYLIKHKILDKWCDCP